MITLHIEHEITDFGTWKQAFERFAGMRRDGGVVSQRVYRPLDDNRYVIIHLDFAAADEARKFLDFLTTRVWASPADAPALAGTPRTRFLEAAAEG
ncbi:hypothetical protein AB0M20_40285 [Actinoplanes sp. NPDC051633]|uniref:hypothetical protein n=1 Tax=Actinoplanes sp. NPDC051633 TaxID=3155670 RepID=UPI0034461C67